MSIPAEAEGGHPIQAITDPMTEAGRKMADHGINPAEIRRIELEAYGMGVVAGFDEGRASNRPAVRAYREGRLAAFDELMEWASDNHEIARRAYHDGPG